MKKSKETIRKSIRLSDEEAADLKAKAELCGLTETEFIRQLIRGQAPKPLPEDRFWDKMNELYECHSRLKRRADQFKNNPELHLFYSKRAAELQDLVIKIIERFTQPDHFSIKDAIDSQESSHEFCEEEESKWQQQVSGTSAEGSLMSSIT